MSEKPPMIILDANGEQCAVAYDSPAWTEGEPQVLVQFNGGEQVLLPMNLLIPQDDGRYRLNGNVQTLLGRYGEYGKGLASDGRLEAGGDLVIPITDETLRVDRRTVETGRVEVHKTVQERVEVVDQPIFAEEVEIERITLNRPLEESVASRYEGETLIIPLVEEVLVVQKRLILREEIHIRKLRKELREPQEVLLRTEQVDVVRKPASGTTASSTGASRTASSEETQEI